MSLLDEAIFGMKPDEFGIPALDKTAKKAAKGDPVTLGFTTYLLQRDAAEEEEAPAEEEEAPAEDATAEEEGELNIRADDYGSMGSTNHNVRDVLHQMYADQGNASVYLYNAVKKGKLTPAEFHETLTFFKS